MKTIKHSSELLEAASEAKNREEWAFDDVKKILHQRGWKYTSDTPGSYWMWEKQLKDGRVLLCPLSMAISVEVNESGEEWPYGE